MKFTLKELAELTDSELLGDPKHLISNVADLESATSLEASFLANPRYEKSMQLSKAGVVFIEHKEHAIEGRNFLVSSDPSRSFQCVLEKFFSAQGVGTGFTGIHSTAVIHETAQIGEDVTIGPHAVIDANVVIGARTVIGSNSYISTDVIIGQDCVIHALVVIRERCQLHNRVILQPGVVIGSCGFGYTNDSKGHYIKLQQIGNVTIEEDVEIGANTTVDRARFSTTRIGKGSKIDNQVQIAHGVTLGEVNCIVSQVGIAGSSTTGKNVIVGGQAGITGHVSICDYAAIAGGTSVTKSITKAGQYRGAPMSTLSAFNRQQVHLRNIDKHVKKIKELEERLEALEKNKS
ncbi:MAG: UDP-3-O-[3-hydroxymyristoyl] glucosamine N-acyltransferase [Chlamydiales bacterium]|jgi:UDP-3-O-[3-hydroxymyristoyl] glucosamine N-acyltransferase